MWIVLSSIFLQQDYIIEEARKSNQSHIQLFYEQYFVDVKVGTIGICWYGITFLILNQAIRNLFEMFMDPEPEPSPAQFLFELPKFDMVRINH